MNWYIQTLKILSLLENIEHQFGIRIDEISLCEDTGQHLPHQPRVLHRLKAGRSRGDQQRYDEVRRPKDLWSEFRNVFEARNRDMGGSAGALR